METVFKRNYHFYETFSGVEVNRKKSTRGPGMYETRNKPGTI